MNFEGRVTEMLGPGKSLRDHIVHLPHFTNEAIKIKDFSIFHSIKIAARSRCAFS